MAQGTTTYLVREARQPIMGGLHLQEGKLTAPNAGAAQTSFTALVAGLKVGDVIVLSPASATAAALAALYADVTADNTVTVTFTSATLDGTEVFHFVAFAGR